MDKTIEFLLVLILALLVLLWVVSAPLIVIACVNTLFGYDIEYTLLNWFCAYLLVIIFSKHNPIQLDLNNKL